MQGFSGQWELMCHSGAGGIPSVPILLVCVYVCVFLSDVQIPLLR